MTTDAPVRECIEVPEMVGSEQVEFYVDNGFLAVPDLLNAAELDELKRDIIYLARGGYPNQTIRPVSDALTDDEVLSKILAIHQPHYVSPVMEKYTRHPKISGVLSQITGAHLAHWSGNVKCMQSMLFIKSAGKPGQAWHQDEAFIPTRDCSLNAAWIALDDATVENGCLWVIPGSHAHRLIWPAKEHDDERFDCVVEAFDFPYTDDDAVPVEVTAGSIVFFNGYLLHRSLPNRAAGGFRRSLVNHYMSAESLLPWRYPGNADLGVASFDFRDIVMIAGRDPYAWKGTEDLSFSHIRPDREGGCQWPTREEE